MAKVTEYSSQVRPGLCREYRFSEVLSGDAQVGFGLFPFSATHECSTQYVSDGRRLRVITEHVHTPIKILLSERDLASTNKPSGRPITAAFQGCLRGLELASGDERICVVTFPSRLVCAALDNQRLQLIEEVQSDIRKAHAAQAPRGGEASIDSVYISETGVHRPLSRLQ